jgi:osmotically-inducible protein OsmY
MNRITSHVTRTGLQPARKTIMKSPLAILALTLCLAGAAHAQAATNTEGATAQQTLQAAMGDKAKDLTVSVSNGVANLQGWAKQPSDVDQARYIVSKVPGITQAHSTQVHTWNSTNR